MRGGRARAGGLHLEGLAGGLAALGGDAGLGGAGGGVGGAVVVEERGLLEVDVGGADGDGAVAVLVDPGELLLAEDLWGEALLEELQLAQVAAHGLRAPALHAERRLRTGNRIESKQIWLI